MMGIDAEMLVKNVSRDLVTDDWLKEKSWRLCQAVGSKHFYLDADNGRSAIQRARNWETESEDGTMWEDDSPVKHEARPGECFLSVNLSSRWYGIGYERGDLLTICATAEWIEQNVPDAEVWYGGDSSGVEMTLFGHEERSALKAHLYGDSGRDYFGSFGRISGREGKGPEPCGLCPGGVYRGNQFGFGQRGQYASFSCAGCGKIVRTRDGGESWAPDDGR